MTSLRKLVVIRLQVEGIHCWPNCDVRGVEYLRNPHRHMFHIEAHKEVSHNDREIEIIMLKRIVSEYLESFDGNFYAMSCEDIAEDLLSRFDFEFVQVLEDNENGAIVKK